MKPVRIGVAGCGLIGRRHVDVVRAGPHCVLAGIADPDPAVATLAASIGVAHYADVGDLIAHEGPDAMVLATPTRLHLADVAACAQAGIHVLVEKPVADSCEASWAAVEAARKAGIVALVGHHRRYYPAVHAARRIVADGGIGRLVGATVVWAARKSDDYFAPEWRRIAGAGPLMNNLVHEVDLLRFICGEIVDVSTQASSAVRGFAVEDSAAVLMRFAGGALATAIISDAAVSPWSFEMATGESRQIAHSGENTMRFLGTQGSLEFPNLRLWRGRDPMRIDWHEAPTASAVETRFIDVYVEQIRHFCAVIHGVEQAIAPIDDGARSLDALRAIIRSAETGAAVRLAAD
jgi:predicted dehydrogenase